MTATGGPLQKEEAFLKDHKTKAYLKATHDQRCQMLCEDQEKRGGFC